MHPRDFGRSAPWQRAYLGGTFDTLHRGHLALFAHARRLALEIVVSLNTDDFATRYKRRPLMPLADRMAVLRECRLVDLVIVNSGDEDSKPAILKSCCDVVVHGSDWTIENGLLEQMGLSTAWLQEHRIDLITLPYTPWVSSTQLIEGYTPICAGPSADPSDTVVHYDAGKGRHLVAVKGKVFDWRVTNVAP